MSVRAMAIGTNKRWFGKCDIKISCQKPRCRGHQCDEEVFSESHGKILEVRSKATGIKCRPEDPSNRSERQGPGEHGQQTSLSSPRRIIIDEDVSCAALRRTKDKASSKRSCKANCKAPHRVYLSRHQGLPQLHLAVDPVHIC